MLNCVENNRPVNHSTGPEMFYCYSGQGCNVNEWSPVKRNSWPIEEGTWPDKMLPNYAKRGLHKGKEC